MHARAAKLLEGEEQCMIEVELRCLIEESCVDQLTISEVGCHTADCRSPVQPQVQNRKQQITFG